MTKKQKKSLLVPAFVAALLISLSGNVSQFIVAINADARTNDNNSRIDKYVNLQDKQIEAVKTSCKYGGLTHYSDEHYKRVKDALDFADKIGKIGNYDYTGIEVKYEESRAAQLCYSAFFALLGEDSYNITTERIIKKSSGSDPYNIDWTELERLKY